MPSVIDTTGGANIFPDSSVIDCEEAVFWHAEFTKWANFDQTKFEGAVNFSRARFKEGATFSGTRFATRASFFGTTFLGRTLFASEQEMGQVSPIFYEVEVDFRKVDIAPLDALIFRDADLRKCQLMGLDLRKAEFTKVKWPEKRGRFRVYDEEVELGEGETRDWSHIEQLYRQLKQNHEDRRDYGRAGDFHYGEKEMRRRNPETPWWLRRLLGAYRCIGGYGERCLPPLAWSAGLLVACALLYLCFGLHPKDVSSTSALTSLWGYFDYSLRVMTLLKPDDLVPIGCARYVSTFESVAGPILLGLFALALRQRLKR